MGYKLDKINKRILYELDKNCRISDNQLAKIVKRSREAVRNIICVGARPIAITDCLNYGNPEKPNVFFDFEEGVKGLAGPLHARVEELADRPS